MKTVIEYNNLYGWNIPTTCPACGTKVEINSSGFPFCPNSDCPRKTAHQFKKMFKVLGVKGCGDAFISKLEEEEISIIDFIKLCEENNSERLCVLMGSINGRKIVQQMNTALTTPISLANFLALFDYHGFDEKKMKNIDFSLEKCYNISISELMKIEGFAEITSQLFVNFMRDKGDEIKELSKHFKIISNEKKEGKLSGLSFCFTGTACKPRPELQKMVEEAGGINKSGVSKGLSYLVNDDIDSTTSKNLKAKDLGIPIISSIQFLEMLKK